MTALLSGTQALRTSAALVLVGAVLSGLVAMLVVAQVSPQPAWISVSAFADNYHPAQVLPYVHRVSLSSRIRGNLDLDCRQD